MIMLEINCIQRLAEAIELLGHFLRPLRPFYGFLLMQTSLQEPDCSTRQIAVAVLAASHLFQTVQSWSVFVECGLRLGLHEYFNELFLDNTWLGQQYENLSLKYSRIIGVRKTSTALFRHLLFSSHAVLADEG
jgi:hypothetical protein